MRHKFTCAVRCLSRLSRMRGVPASVSITLASLRSALRAEARGSPAAPGFIH